MHRAGDNRGIFSSRTDHSPVELWDIHLLTVVMRPLMDVVAKFGEAGESNGSQWIEVLVATGLKWEQL